MTDPPRDGYSDSRNREDARPEPQPIHVVFVLADMATALIRRVARYDTEPIR